MFLIFYFFLLLKTKKGKGNGLERCRMSSVQKRKTGIHPSVCFFSSIPGRTTLREQRKKKKKEETRAHDVSDVIHCVCGGGGGAKGISERVTLLLPNPPTFFVE
jgi:UDP-N-acetylglucosamine:LPS N-acetylglucosamine transferase